MPQTVVVKLQKAFRKVKRFADKIQIKFVISRNLHVCSFEKQVQN